MEYSFYEDIVHANTSENYGPGYLYYMERIVFLLLIRSITAQFIILFFTLKSLRLLS